MAATKKIPPELRLRIQIVCKHCNCKHHWRQISVCYMKCNLSNNIGHIVFTDITLKLSGIGTVMKMKSFFSSLWRNQFRWLNSSLLQTWKNRSTSLSYFKFADICMQNDVEIRCPAAWQLRSMLQRRSVVDRKVAGNQPGADKVWSRSHRVTVLHDFVYKCPSTGCSERERKNTPLKFFN